jgi:hypothetical protein
MDGMLIPIEVGHDLVEIPDAKPVEPQWSTTCVGHTGTI